MVSEEGVANVVAAIYGLDVADVTRSVDMCRNGADARTIPSVPAAIAVFDICTGVITFNLAHKLGGGEESSHA